MTCLMIGDCDVQDVGSVVRLVECGDMFNDR